MSFLFHLDCKSLREIILLNGAFLGKGNYGSMLVMEDLPSLTTLVSAYMSLGAFNKVTMRSM